MTSLSIIIASSGRPTLQRTLDSIMPQTKDQDEVLVSINRDCPWGHRARNQLIRAARGDALLFMDDDDVYLLGALELVRERVSAAPRRPHVFRMEYGDGRPTLWRDQEVKIGNVSTQMIVAPGWETVRTSGMPAIHDGGIYPAEFGDRYEGDFDFISDVVHYFGLPEWHEEIIARIRPS